MPVKNASLSPRGRRAFLRGRYILPLFLFQPFFFNAAPSFPAMETARAILHIPRLRYTNTGTGSAPLHSGEEHRGEKRGRYYRNSRGGSNFVFLGALYVPTHPDDARRDPALRSCCWKSLHRVKPPPPPSPRTLPPALTLPLSRSLILFRGLYCDTAGIYLQSVRREVE